jgi:uncharacterized coiled-coil protein SlyX
MFEQLEALVGRVEAMVRMLEEARRRIDDLTAENQRLHSQLDERNHAVEHNVALQQQIQELQQHLEEKTGKESQIRDRLKGLLDRIETIEQEAGNSGQH